MSLITNSLTFTIGDAAPVESTAADIEFATPAGSRVLPGDPVGGTPNELRMLIYPSGLLPPLIYTDNPDVYTNFHTSPLDKRPRAFVQSTLTDNMLIGWIGKSRDVSIEERWLGSTTQSHMTLDFFLALKDYYNNPPIDGSFIQWCPRDRTSEKYYIVIQDLSLSLTGSAGQGAGDFEFDYVVTRHGYLAGSVTLRFSIQGVV